jgi:hypothetical protein
MSWLRDAAHKVLQITHGRTTAFCIAFFVSGNTLAVLHNAAGDSLLTSTYVYFMATLGGLVLGHSVKEDLVELKNRAQGGPPRERIPDVNNPT